MNLLQNPFITGTLMVLVSGALASRAMAVPSKLFGWIKRKILLSVEIDSNDPAHAWVKRWLAENAKTRWLIGNAIFPESDGVPGPTETPRSSRQRPLFVLSPHGFCWVRFKGHRIIVWIERETIQGATHYREKLTLQCLWGGTRHLFTELLAEAHDLARGVDARCIEIWLPDSQYWQVANTKPLRKASTLCLPPGIVDQVIEDARLFQRSADWYHRMGIPWRRGYLFYGPPGNGKTSLVHVMASELRTNINVLSLSSVYDDSHLLSCVIRVPRGHIILLEDVDAAFTKRDSKIGVTFSGVLNAIDGAGAQEGRIVVMTTNHKDKLDPALIRAGRADVHIELGDATARQAAEMHERFFPRAIGREDAAFGVANAGKSMAEIQRLLLELRACEQKTVAEVEAA